MTKYLFYCFSIFLSGFATGQDSASYWWLKTDSAYRIPDFELGQQYEEQYRKANKYPPSKIFALANNAVQRNYEKFSALFTAKKTVEALSFGNWLLSALRTIDTSRYEVKYWVRINEQLIQAFYSLQLPDSAARYRANIYNLAFGTQLPEEVDSDFRFIDGLYEHKYVRATEWLFGNNKRSDYNCVVKQKYILFDSAGPRKGQFELSLVKLPSYNNDVPFDYVLTRLNLEGLGYHHPQEGVLLAYKYNEPLDYNQIDKDIRAIIRDKYREAIVPLNDSIRLKEKIREAMMKMSQALVAKDFGNFVTYLHPITRGRHPELKDAVTYYQQLYKDNNRFRFISAEAGEPGKLVQYNGELQTVVTWTVHFSSGTKRYKEVRTMSAHSLDHGKTWYFYEPFSIARGEERLRPGLAMNRGVPFISSELKIAPTIQTELQ